MMQSNGIRGRVCTVIVLAALCAADLPAADTPDYRRGFETLYALGLPDVAAATYVRLDVLPRSVAGMLNLHGIERPALDGAWLLDAIDAEEAVVLIGGIHRLTLVSPAKREREQDGRTPVSAWDWDAGQATGTWTEAVPSTDALAIIAYLREQGEPGTQSRHNQHRLHATLFLQAAHLHRSGNEAEANTIVHMLFEAAGQDGVLEAALSLMADVHYADSYQAFTQTRDWQALHDAVATLLQRFTRGWQRRDAVAQLLPGLTERLSGAAPVPADASLSETDLALAAELASATNIPLRVAQELRAYAHAGSRLWVLPGADRGPPTPDASPPTVLDRIKARGLDAIPMLLALSGDTYPTAFDHHNGPIAAFMYRSSYHGAATSPQALAQRTRLFFNDLPRPLTRGEIADRLLQQVVPRVTDHFGGGAYGDRQALPDELLTRIREWYEAHAGKSPLELAMAYVEDEAFEGSPQQQVALHYLIREGGEPQWAFMEAALLQGNLVQNAHLVKAYGLARQEAAHPFIEAYVAKLRGPEADDDEEGDGQDALFVASPQANHQAAQVQRLLREFEDILKNESYGEVIETILSGARTLQEASSLLHAKIGQESPGEMVAMLLDAAIRADRPALTVQFLEMVGSLGFFLQASARGPLRGAGGEAGEPLEPPTPADHAERWRTLLDDETRNPGFSQQPGLPGNTVGELAVIAMDRLTQTGGTRGHGISAHALLGRRGYALLMERARSLIAGEAPDALPPMPKAATVTGTERAALIASLLDAAPSDLPARLDALSLDALLAVIEASGKDDALRQALWAHAAAVRTVNVTAGDDGIKAGLEALHGTLLSRELVEKLVAMLQALSPGGKPAVMLTVTRTPALEGVEINLLPLESATLEGWQHMRHIYASAQTTPALHASLFAGGHRHAQGRWPLPAADADDAAGQPAAVDSRRQAFIDMITASGEAIPPEMLTMIANMADEEFSSMTLGDPFGAEQNDRFWQAIEAVCGEEGNLGYPVVIAFLSGNPEDDAATNTP